MLFSAYDGIENIVEKEENAGYHFLLFPHFFLKSFFYRIVKMSFSVYDRIEDIVEKGENAGYQHFLLFPQCFQKASIGP